MSNEIKVFSNEEFGCVRTVMIDGEPWFVAADVCKALELDKTATRRLDEDEKGLCSTQTLGGEQKVGVVNEPGLYSLVLGSRKPEAKAFKRWITHEVIPSIRKTGMYTTKQTAESLMSDPRTFAQILTAYADAQDKIKEQEIEIADKSLQLEEKINANKGLTEDISVADKRKRISNLVKSGYNTTQIRERWKFLYEEFNNKYSVNVYTQYKHYKDKYKPKLTSTLDCVERHLGMLDELFMLACKLFGRDYGSFLQDIVAAKKDPSAIERKKQAIKEAKKNLKEQKALSEDESKVVKLFG